MRKEKIAANVVTYNRKELLKGCLNALLKQSRKPDLIIVVDNNSTDGTREMLEKEFLSDPIFDYVRLEENTGSAGGQYTGIKRAYEKGFDWVWCMDDDTIPQENSLELFVEAKLVLEQNSENIGFLSSKVIDLNGDDCNVPSIDRLDGFSEGLSKKKFNYPQWGKYLNHGIIQICSSTFVSILINAEAIKEVGLPIRDFFIWGDDTEFTTRISSKFSCFLAGKSIVLHKRVLKGRPNIVTEKDKKRLGNFYYKYRNILYTYRKHAGILGLIYFCLKSILEIFKVALFSNHKTLKIIIIIKGLFSGFFFSPKISLKK